MDDKMAKRFRGAVVAGTILLYAAAAYIIAKVVLMKPESDAAPSINDLTAIFFGASSLGLIIFSLVVAIAALVQWRDLKEEVARATKSAEAAIEKIEKAITEKIEISIQENQARVERLEKAMQDHVKALETELRGRVDAVNGAMIGTLHSDPASPKQKEDDMDYISEAIYHCQRGYDRLKELPGNGKWMALNSVVYFSCLLGSQAKRDILLEQGRELRKIGIQYESLPYSAPYLLTFCHVALTYSLDRGELEQALAIARDRLATNLTSLQKKEATYLVASLNDKLAKLGLS